MATGYQGSPLGNPIFRILEGATATNGVPSGSSAGHAMPTGALAIVPGSTVSIGVYSTAGSATMTATIRLWVYMTGQWLPLGIGGDTTKGILNAGAAIGESSTEKIAHVELITMGRFERMYAEVTAIGGTSTAVNVDVMF